MSDAQIPPMGPHPITSSFDMACPMRDGVVLRADVYRPEGAGTWPVLLARTTYDKKGEMFAPVARDIASFGYVVAVQDVRGRYASDGEYHWMFGPAGQEVNARDGYDSVEWAAQLPWSDGRVGVWGNSYSSAAAWRLAPLQPPSLAAIFASGMPTRHRDMTSGILETGRRLQWAYSAAADIRRRAGEPFGPYTAEEANEVWRVLDRGKWIWRLPLSSIPEYVFSGLTGQVHELGRHPEAEFWDFQAGHPKFNVPVACLTAWWDRLIGIVDHYTGLMTDGPEETRSEHRLIIGPWTHQTELYARKLGPRDYGPIADTPYVKLLVGFFDRVLKGKPDEDPEGKPVKIFILNENQWRYFENWPPEGVQMESLFLKSGGAANTPAGDGVLDSNPGGEADRYAYDPADPVPSLITLDSLYVPADQSPLAGRRDILVYQTAPLEEDLVLAGPVTCRLWVATDAPDTDFTARLIEVAPDGSNVQVSTGIIRCRYRTGYDTPTPMTPGAPCELTIRMNPVGIRLPRGYRLRLDISSSDFPAFDRNHNTGADPWTDAELRVAQQTVFHDEAHPSRLELPVLRES